MLYTRSNFFIMSIFNHRADILPVSIFVGYFFVDILAYFLIQDRLILGLYVLVGVGLKVLSVHGITTTNILRLLVYHYSIGFLRLCMLFRREL